MFFIGVDIAKFDHYGCAIDSNGTVVVEPFSFHNDKEGFKLFSSKLKTVISSNDYIIGMEDTGHYTDTLIDYLLDKEYKVALINPITTNQFRKMERKTSKNDKVDSLLIATVLSLGPSKYRIITKESFATKEIKQLTRMHHDLKEQLTVHKNKLQADLDILFPEFNELFESKYSVHYLTILENFPSAASIASTDIRTIKNVMNIKGRGIRCSFTAEQLKKAAKNSVGEKNAVLELEVKYLISIIRLMNKQVDEIDSKIKEFSSELNSPILDIPGISHFSCMSIVSEIGDIKKFPCSSKLIRFAGVDPYDSQSGLYKANTTSINKLGSRYLRKTLYQIILPVIKYNPVFQQYYSKKIQQGKSHRCACGHCVRKLLRVIYRLLYSNIRFDKQLLV